MRSFSELNHLLAESIPHDETRDGDWLWTSYDVVKFTGCTYRQLDYWCRTGLIRPAIPARGSGSYRRFFSNQVREVWLITRLIEFGISLQHIRADGAYETARHIHDELTPVVSNKLLSAL